MKTLAATAVLLLAAAPALAEPGVERWNALSHTATAITGDITLSPTQLKTPTARLPLTVAADVPAFQTDTGPVAARILRLTRPANPKLLNGNRFCTAPVRWIVVWRDKPGPEGNLGMAVFSGDTRPTDETSPDLCGTFSYVRP